MTTYYPTPATLELAPLASEECHKLDVIAEYLSQEERRPSFAAVKLAAAKRGFRLVAEKSEDEPDYDLPIQSIGLFVRDQQFVIAYGWMPGSEYCTAYDWTDADGFDNDLRRWAEWDTDHARRSVALAVA